VAALDAIPASRRAAWRLHRVEKGETLAAIARRYRTAASAIVSANNNNVSAPEAGDVLLIPVVYQERPASVRAAAKSGRRVSGARASSGRRVPVRRVSSQRVPSKVLQRRAPARRLKTASIGSSAGGQ
jgi:LysM repeat protein